MAQAVLGQICVKCNGGWMSELEATAMQVLIPLIEGRSTLTNLSISERLLVARWSAKTACTHNWSSSYDRIIPLEHFRAIRECPTRLPRGMAVFARQCDAGTAFMAHQDRQWIRQAQILNVSEAQFHGLTEKSYKISFLLGHLALSVAFWPPELGWKFLIQPELHQFQLWNWQRDVLVNLTLSSTTVSNPLDVHLGMQKLLGIAYDGRENRPLMVE